MSNTVPWDDLKNGKPVPPINVQGSDGSGIKTEQRSGMTYHQFSAEKETEKKENNWQDNGCYQYHNRELAISGIELDLK